MQESQAGKSVTDRTPIGTSVRWLEPVHTYEILTNAYQDEDGQTCRVIGRRGVTLIVLQENLKLIQGSEI